MKKLMTLRASLFALSLAGSASAIPVDFRDASFAAGTGLNHYEQTAASYEFTFDTLRDSDMQHEGTLYWGAVGGFGIRNSNNWDADEIEGSEILKLSFGEELYLESFTVAKLYIEANIVEHGLYSVDGGASWGHFYADGLHANGEVTVNLDVETDSILFKSAGKTGFRRGHEFSLAAIDLGREHYGSAVPEPLAALLFAAGALVVRSRSRCA